MEYKYVISPRKELYHYGIKGQKWGVRRFQDKTGRLTSVGRKRYSDNNTKSEDKNEQKLKLTDKQKKAIKIGAAVAATALVTYGVYKLSKSGKFESLTNTLETRVGTGLNKQHMKRSISKDLKAVNPNFNVNDQSSYMNCGNCSIAFELRRRGYDVTALGNKTGMRVEQLGEFFKGFNENSFHTAEFDVPNTGRGKAVKEQLMSQISDAYKGDARGTVFFTHNYGSHFFSWVKDKDGVKFYDAQNPNANLDAMFSNYKRHTRQNSAIQTKFVRLDDLEINNDTIQSIVKNVRDKSRDFNDTDFDTWASKGKDFITKFVT